MTDKQILEASLLDIVFENRNKEYGAYALRKGYDMRLLKALGTGIILLLFIISISLFNKKEKTLLVKMEAPGIVIREINLPEKKIEKPIAKEEIVKPKAAKTIQPKLAAVKFTAPPKVVEVVKEPLAAIENMEGKLTSDKNKEGELVEKNKVIPMLVESKSETGIKSGPSEPESVFIIQERDPEYPGGQEALSKFLGRYLTSPGQLDAGQRKVVKIKFKIDKDGSLNTFEIVTSGGFEFDNEVVSVCKKMPKWIPALQNGINVPVNYVLPVTFVGADE